jgi:hypothetical protein
VSNATKLSAINNMIDIKISSVTSELNQLKEAVSTELHRPDPNKVTMGDRFLRGLAFMMGKKIKLDIPTSGKTNPLASTFSRPVDVDTPTLKSTKAKKSYNGAKKSYNKKKPPQPHANTPPELAAAYDTNAFPVFNKRAITVGIRDRMYKFAELYLNGVSLNETRDKLNMTQKLAEKYRRDFFPTLRRGYPLGDVIIETTEEKNESLMFDIKYIPEVSSKTPQFYAGRYDVSSIHSYMGGDKVNFVKFVSMILDGETTLAIRKKLNLSDYLATKFMEAGFGTRSLMGPPKLNAPDNGDSDTPVRVVPQPIINLENCVSSRVACFDLTPLSERCDYLNTNHVYSGVWNQKRLAYDRRVEFANIWMVGTSDPEICDIMGIKNHTLKNMRKELFPTWG